MKYLRILSTLFRRKIFVHSSSLHILRTTSNSDVFNSRTTQIFKDKMNGKLIHTDNTDSENDESLEDFPILESETRNRENVKYLIFKHSQDDIISKLNSCVSIEEVLSLVVNYINIYEDKHVVQTILVLRGLQKIFFQYKGFNTTASNMFLESLRTNKGFHFLLRYIEDNLQSFDSEYLTHVLLYLNKLGIPVEDQLIQNIALKVRDHLLQDFHLSQCSRFLAVIFSENSVRPYYISIPIIPLVINCIEKCESVDDLYDLSICLNKLHNIITLDILNKYKIKVTAFLKDKKLQGTDYPTLLKIILLLNYPEWRDQYVPLTSECILLLKDKINLLNVEDLTVLYEIFFKIQEPGALLSSIQRCAAKFLQELDETDIVYNTMNSRLKLFSCLIYFSSPVHRIQFRKQLSKYLNHCHNDRALIQLRKIFSYIKVSDSNLCGKYWSLALKILNENVESNLVLKLSQNYIHFNTDIDNYRHYKFEDSIMSYIIKSFSSDLFLNPTKIAAYLSFAMLYGRDRDILELLLNKFQENWTRASVADCLNVSYTLSLLHSGKNTYMSPKQIEKTKTILNLCTKNLLTNAEKKYIQISALLKAFIFRNDFDNELLELLLMKYKELDYMSSKIIENISYVCLSTDSLVPELINKCTEYVLRYKNNILGFNAEKLLTLCYYLDYYPTHGDEFFDVAINVIIRDQERLSGLAFLQSALSLCYFNKLPGSFIKLIFNVEFLEKLDMELENCYSKEKYPQRVRQVLMVLNRAVCLEYPEYNVPWFHKKYLDDIQKKSVKDFDNKFQRRIKLYLMQLLGTQDHIVENVTTPYGYFINFVINLNSKGETVSSDSTDVARRVAILLLRQHAFTRFYQRLKGKYQLKIRHLEMFGYEVAIINLNEWLNLLYGEERLEYLSQLIRPSNKECTTANGNVFKE